MVVSSRRRDEIRARLGALLLACGIGLLGLGFGSLAARYREPALHRHDELYRCQR